MPKYSSSFPDFLECFESSNYYYIIYELLKYTLEKKSDEYGASMPGILHFFKKNPTQQSRATQYINLVEGA